MIKLIFFLMGCYGISTILVQSKIMEPLRSYFKTKNTYLHKLSTCMMCTGFWVSIISSFSLQYSISYNIFADGDFINVFDFFFESFILIRLRKILKWFYQVTLK